MVHTCAVCSAEDSIKNPELIFHSLPKDPETQEKWLKILGKVGVKRLKVCSRHFAPEDYKELCDRPLLKKGVVPRLSASTNCSGSSGNNASHSEESVNNTDDNIECEVSAEGDDETGVNAVIIKSTFEEAPDEHIKPDYTRKRKNEGIIDLFNFPSKRSCNLKDFGYFTSDIAKDEMSWKRIYYAFQGLKRENHLLNRQNERLRLKIDALKVRLKWFLDHQSVKCENSHFS